MCGISGIYNFKDAPANRDILHKMTSSMAHRGPDGMGFYSAERVGFGHRRLSIIDIDGGSQPMESADKAIALVFNGEIYNFIELKEDLEKIGHKFRTRSDTEVIIHAYEEWGLECVKRFNGIFAFAIWDASLQRLILARDHLGVKPLYYTVLNDRLLFASEIKALLQDPECRAGVDIKSLGELFTFRYVPSPSTLFRGIKKLPPAHIMAIDGSGTEIRRYWDTRPKINRSRAEGEWIEEYTALLEDAVKLQMRSDVPVGLFLSSGIDSCTLLSVMSKLSGRPVNTFTIGFEDGERTNETDDAREFAKICGADHTEMIVGPKDYEKYYERYLWDIEEPLGNETAAAFYFVSMIAGKKVKVALSGQGADEPWAGYHRYIGVKLSDLYSRLPQFMTEGMVKTLVRALPRNERLKRGAASLNEPDMLTRFAKIYSFFSAEMKNELFQDWVKEELASNDAKKALKWLQSDVEGLDPLTQILYIDTRASLPDDLLMVADKTAMANSLEARVPFLDYRLIELIETMPPDLKLRGFRGKYLHKKAVEKWLPREMVYRKKKGFANPIDKWLRNKMSSFVKGSLLDEGSAACKYFNRPYIEKLIKLHESGKEDYLRHIYLLISFELWHKRFIN